MNWKPTKEKEYLTYKLWQESPVGQEWEGYLFWPFSFIFNESKHHKITSCQFYDDDYIRMVSCYSASSSKKDFIKLTIKKLDAKNTRVDITGEYKGKTKYFDYSRMTGAVGLWKDKTGFEIKWTDKDPKCKQFQLYAYTHKEFLTVMDYPENNRPLYTQKKPEKIYKFEFIMNGFFKR